MRWVVVGCGGAAAAGSSPFVLFLLFLAVWQYVAPTERVVAPKRGVSQPM